MTKDSDNPKKKMPRLRFSPGSTVAPGDRIGSVRDVDVVRPPDTGDGEVDRGGAGGTGTGVYRRGNHVYASLVGTLAVSDEKVGGLPVVSVIPIKNKKKGGSHAPSTTSASSQVLTVGQLVLGRVLRVQSQMTTVEIVAATSIAAGPGEDGVGGTAVALKDPRGGIVRREDVQPGGGGGTTTSTSTSTSGTDELVMYDCYRPGDVIVARILSLGDARRYFLSTDEPPLGVVRAKCSCCRGGTNGGGGGGGNDGTVVVPANWKEMECPVTKDRERRKVAKPSPTAHGGGGRDKQDEVSKFLKSL